MGDLLKRFLPGHRAHVAIGMAAKAVEVVFDLLTPVIVARMIDAGVRQGNTDLVMRLGALLILLACVGYCFTLVCQKMAALTSQGMGTQIRDALFSKVMDLGAADVDRFGTPSLVTRVTNDVNQVQVAVALGIRQLIRWPILAVGSIVAACLINLRLGLIFLACTVVVFAVFYLVMAKSVPYFRGMQDKLDRISTITREALSGVRVIRAFRQEEREQARFKETAWDQAGVAVAVGRLSALLSPASLLVMNLGVVAVLWQGGGFVQAGDLTQGQLVAFVNYMTQALVSITYVANLVVVFTRSDASAGRIMEVLRCEPSVQDGLAGEEGLPADAPVLELDHASFRYAGSPVDALADVTLALPEGGTLGVIGGTGSGKSTLVSLIPRLYDASAGSVRVDGRDVRDWQLESLRNQVALVPQQASLVSGTIRDNLLWRNPEATDDDLWQALELAQAADFVRERPEGLDSPVEAGGKNFSGGQRQRLTIARALVGSPRLVLLDDSASALDFATDARLRAALRTLAPKTASLVVSQRVSAVMGADQVLVLDHGRVAGLGTHKDLVRTCPLYREICLSQLRREEVGA